MYRNDVMIFLWGRICEKYPDTLKICLSYDSQPGSSIWLKFVSTFQRFRVSENLWSTGIQVSTYCLRAGGWWDWAWCPLILWSTQMFSVLHSNLGANQRTRETAPHRSPPRERPQSQFTDVTLKLFCSHCIIYRYSVILLTCLIIFYWNLSVLRLRNLSDLSKKRKILVS